MPIYMRIQAKRLKHQQRRQYRHHHPTILDIAFFACLIANIQENLQILLGG